METKFTTGEWMINPEVEVNGYGVVETYLRADKVTHFVAIFGDDEEAKANTKLIAAAPEMYKALRTLVEQIEMFTCGNIGEQEYFRYEISQAKQALKKATE